MPCGLGSCIRAAVEGRRGGNVALPGLQGRSLVVEALGLGLNASPGTARRDWSGAVC